MELSSENKFEALKIRFLDQVELLHRLTMIDLRIFSGFITLQLALGAWLTTQQNMLFTLKFGLGVIDFGLAFVAYALLRNNTLRRKEVVGTVVNCATALKYKEPGYYLDGEEPLDSKSKLRLWKGYYNFGILITLVGIYLILLFG